MDMKEKIIKYKGYSIRNWIHPSGRKMLVAIPLKAKCFVCFMDYGTTEKIALKDIKLFINAQINSEKKI